MSRPVGAEWGGVWGGGVPSSMGRGLGSEGAMPSPIFFKIRSLYRIYQNLYWFLIFYLNTVLRVGLYLLLLQHWVIHIV